MHRLLNHKKSPAPRPVAATALGALAAAFLAAGVTSADRPATGSETPTFKVYVRETGVYRLGYDALEKAGLEAPVGSRRLALSHRGRAVPIWIEDGGDGRFEPGDHVEFLGEHLAGERSFYNEETPLNVYFLSTAGGGERMEPAGRRARRSRPGAAAHWRVERHLEHDRLLLRFAPPREGRPPEPWYWAKITHLRRNAFEEELDLHDLDLGSSEPASLRIELRGWSEPRHKGGPEMADHRVEVRLNDAIVGSGEWNGQEAHVIEVPDLPREHLVAGTNSLRLEIPARFLEGEEDPLIDVVMLNWLELSYPRRARLERPQVALRLADGAPRSLRLEAPADRPLTLYGRGGRRLEGERLRPEVVAQDGIETALYRFRRPRDERELYAVLGDGHLAPAAVELDRPSDLLATDRQADYLMITHPRLRAAIEPLADFHRRRGLSVEVVEVDDVYDEFNHGILHPRAIRDFLAHAYHRWRPPAPRFVLLVGDASWDVKNAEADDASYADWTYRPGEQRRFVKNASTPYAREASLGHRNLVPTWHYESHQGHAASDNQLVAVDGDDLLPEMAIGRLPVTEPEEVAAIVAKTVRYAESSEVGPWRRRVLWITNEMRSFQNRSDAISAEIGARGFDSLKVYPSSEEASNEHHQEALRQAFDAGQLLVHFFGHGGRYIWRTGPPDYRKNHDLFTLEDLDQLAPTDNLPVVLSMTCYSAPFDHPTADSIGEKFLRLADRGAVAVLGASWRSSPSAAFSRALVERLTRPGTIGEAILEAKREVASEQMLQLFNLLGDPAIPIAAPQEQLRLEPAADGRTLVAGVDAEGFEGRAVVDWLDAEGGVLESRELEVAGPRFTIDLGTASEAARSVVVYAWSTERRLDALGRFELDPGGEAEAR